MATLTQIYDWFKTGKKPTQAQFWASWGSFFHKDEQIPQSSILGLTSVLSQKAEITQLNGHKTDITAHADLFNSKEDKSQKGLANGYVPLNDIVQIGYQYLSIVNDLISGGETDLLSAEQGVVLQTQINNINILLGSDNVNLDNVQELVDAIEAIQLSLDTILVNDLTTGGTTKALTAEMGKNLKGLYDSLVPNKVDKWISGTYPLGKFVSHKINDKYYLFQSQVNNNSTEPILSKGVQPFKPYVYGGSYVGVWSAGSYVVGNIVSRNSFLYYCLTNTTTDPQLLTPPYWLKIGVDQGVYSNVFAGGYALGDAVRDVSNGVYISQLNFNSFALTTVSNNSWDLISGNPFGVATWGDSLTAGTGSDGNGNYPSVLSNITGLNIWNGGVPGETSTQIKNRFLADKSKWSLPTIFWVGRNNYTDGVTVKADIAEMVSKLGHKRYLVLGIIKATSDSAEPINTLNSELKSIYKDKFVDLQPYLLRFYNPLIPQDVVDHANGVIAWSLRSDWLHLNTYGYSLVAELMATRVSYLTNSAKQRASVLNAGSIRVTDNIESDELVKSVEIGYKDTVEDLGFIQAYDRINGTTKPFSVQYSAGSELRLVENGGSLKIGEIGSYSSGEIVLLTVDSGTGLKEVRKVAFSTIANKITSLGGSQDANAIFSSFPLNTIGNVNVPDCANAPITSGWWSIESRRFSSETYGSQIAYGIIQNAGKLFVRDLNNGVWSAWTEK